MTLRLKIPDAPKDLFRKLKAQIKSNGSSLDMSYWHTDEHGNILISKQEVKKCSTVHCLAGWINVLTPGGVDLEFKLSDRYTFFPHLDGDLSPYVQKAEGEAAAAALLILEKAGWSQHIRHSHFHSSSKHALALIHRLAKIEGDRHRRRKKKAA